MTLHDDVRREHAVLDGDAVVAGVDFHVARRVVGERDRHEVHTAAPAHDVARERAFESHHERAATTGGRRPDLLAGLGRHDRGLVVGVVSRLTAGQEEDCEEQNEQDVHGVPSPQGPENSTLFFAFCQ